MRRPPRFLATAFSDRTTAAPKLWADLGRVDRTVQTTPRELVDPFATLRDAAGGKNHVILRPDQRAEFIYPVAVRSGRFDELYAHYSIIYGRFRPGRHRFANISIDRNDDGSLSLKVPTNGTTEDGFGDDNWVQVTL